MKYLVIILTLCTLTFAATPQPTPFPTPVPMLKTSLQDGYYFENNNYLSIDFDIIEPKNLTQMSIYLEDVDKCFDKSEVYQKNPPSVTRWNIVLLPNIDAKVACKLILVFLYNGYVDKRLVNIYNAGDNELWER